jgi:hypothetical protein
MIYFEEVETHRYEYGNAAKIKAQKIAMALENKAIELFDVYGEKIQFFDSQNQITYVRAPDKKWAICVTNQFHISPSGYQEIGSIRALDPNGPWGRLSLGPTEGEDRAGCAIRGVALLAVIFLVILVFVIFR